MEHINIQKDRTFITKLEARLNSEGSFSSWNLFQLAYEAANQTISPSFNGLRALEYLPHVQFLDHQVKSAETVIEQMNGRAILADEVGLGKTIEAGLIIKEYMIRGSVKKILLLVPASLVNQWVRELNDKFYIPAVAFRKNYAWDQYDIFVTSIDTAKRSPHIEAILELDYDLLLIDEAHKLKNHKTKNYQFVQSIKKKYCLLLTATPVQNQLIEIFNLISVLKPGHLGSYRSFQEKFGKDRNKLKKDAFLKQLIQKVMVRNTRKNTELDNVKRNIQTIWINFSTVETEAYKALENDVDFLTGFSKLTYLREFCSSREACFLSLEKLMNSNNNTAAIETLMHTIEQLPHHSKAIKVLELIKQIGNEKVIIFTEYRATQYYLQWYLQQHHIRSVPFRGGFNRSKKDWMQQLFKNHVQVLIATEAGGEGINLQFCNNLINYDLPWNPMRLEQRIGRVHRFGQRNDVNIYNLAINGTIEEHIMKLLYEKIGLFEKVIGQLDHILEELHIHNLEAELESIFSESTSAGEIKIKMNNLTSIIENTNNLLHDGERDYGNF
ncbi:DEAD/DEAH box helicase [Virgibacillus sp. W0430]|uniref:DEAD/DEAH box helicase n=1 Tax=Virgibacillus sp. W0430 TaxID=3391580 RepID=UPI003F4901A5